MKVFLSWSDRTSHKVAAALGDWLPYVIQAITPFISSDNINKGERWQDDLVDQLKKASYGIICLTRHNINDAWMNFEAGAISNTIPQSCVSPFLFYVESRKVIGPLQQFQLTAYGKDDNFNKEELFKLVSSINNTLGPEQQVPHERLRRQFENWWGELKKNLDDVFVNSEVEGMAGLKWLFLREDIIKIQEQIDCKNVWIIASRLYPFLFEDDIKDILQNNIKRGVKYTYIIPDSDENKGYVQQFNSLYATNSNHPSFLTIQQDQFNSLAAANYIILNPHADVYPRRMFLELPIDLEVKYWIEVEGEAALNFVTRFSPLANGHPINSSPASGKHRRG